MLYPLGVSGNALHLAVAFSNLVTFYKERKNYAGTNIAKCKTSYNGKGV